jgi:hypothetical protein
MKWARHIILREMMRTEYSIFVGKPEVNGQLGDLGIGGKLII